MIKAHEQELELRLPRIGIIRKGGPMTTGAKPSDTRPGKDLDHFRLDRAEQSVIDAWNETLGKEPKAISGILPYADPAECLNIWDELWQGKRLQWRGDGERLHVKLEGNAYVRYAPGQGPAQPAAAGEKVGSLKVARLSRLRILLPQLRIAGIFEIMSSSAIDADELWSNLMWIKSTVATLQGAPVTVFRAARQFNVPQKDGNTMAVTKHMLHMMLDGRYLDALLPSPVAGMLAPVQPPPALTAGQVEDDAPDFDEGDYEDAQPARYLHGTLVAQKDLKAWDAFVDNNEGDVPEDYAHLQRWVEKWDGKPNPRPVTPPPAPPKATIAPPPQANGHLLYGNGAVVRPQKVDDYQAYIDAHPDGKLPYNQKHLDDWLASLTDEEPAAPVAEGVDAPLFPLSEGAYEVR